MTYSMVSILASTNTHELTLGILLEFPRSPVSGHFLMRIRMKTSLTCMTAHDHPDTGTRLGQVQERGKRVRRRRKKWKAGDAVAQAVVHVP